MPRLTPKERISICRRCRFSKKNFVGLTCGTLLRPTYDKYGNELTCGCQLDIKIYIKREFCPQEKW